MKIINLKTYKGPKNYVYCGRPSPLGNPFNVNEYGRKECIKLYEEWAEAQIQLKVPHFCNAMAALNENSILACFCEPLPCHCNIIEKLWKKYYGPTKP